MSYFLPSFLQKRLLRYALSRLELLDTKALDLEKLDIVWGRRSTVELRDVGLHHAKLAALLQLPPDLVILSAQILFLRLTIPADLYQSGIVVEVEGVHVRVKVEMGQRGKDGISCLHHEGKRNDFSKNAKADRPRNTQSQVHDPGGASFGVSRGRSDAEENVTNHLPTTADLANSFLQTEPQEEKAELQASIAHLSQSRAYGANEDSASDLGIGDTISLPGFLTGFLKGVADRIQLIVTNVKLDLDLEVGFRPERSVDDDGPSLDESATIRLIMGSVDIRSVSGLEITAQRDDSHGVDPPKTRLVTLSDIEIMVISEASLFENFAHSAGPSSPKTTRACTMVKPSDNQTAMNDCLAGHTSSSADEKIPYGGSLQSSTSSSSVDSQVYQDAGNEDDHLLMAQCSGNALEDSHDHGSILTNPFQASIEPGQHEKSISSHLPPGSLLYDNTVDVEKPNEFDAYSMIYTGSNPDETTPPANFDTLGAILDMTEKSELKSNRDVLSQCRLESYSRSASTPIVGARTPPSTSVYDQDDLQASEDLTQSKLFSHDEAKSMYMSAMSHTSSSQKDKSMPMPGDWNVSYPDEDGKDISTANDDRLQENEFSAFEPEVFPIDSDRQDTSPSDSLQDNWPLRSFEEKSLLGNFILPQAPASITPKAQSHEKAFDHGNSLSPQSEASSADLKSSFVIIKRLMSIDSILLRLPPEYSDVTENHTQTQASHSSGSLRQNQETPALSLPAHTGRNPSLPIDFRRSVEKQSHRSPTCIEIGDIQLLADVGLIKMTIPLVHQLRTILKYASRDVVGKEAPRKPLRENASLEIKVQSLHWKFLDAVRGLPAADFRSGLLKTGREPLCADSDILLRADVESFGVLYREIEDHIVITFSVGKLSFGRNAGSLLSFDSGLKMRESTRDILAPIDNDVVVTIMQTSTMRKIDLATLPLHINLDIQQLDETFSWFGGFSSMVGLGSSMMSTMTVVDAASKKPIRAVHFENQAKGPSISSQPHGLTQRQNKMTARLGGIVFDIRGTTTSLRFKSTAVKLVSRVEGVGLQVDRLNLNGPYTLQPDSESSICLKFINLRVEYLSVPKEVDLARMLALLSPSKNKYERDDDIVLETLLRQRRQGGVLRATIECLEGQFASLDDLQCFPSLVEDLRKFATVTKYLPEDDRPGLLTLGLVRELKLEIAAKSSLGKITSASRDMEVVYVTFPSLVALSINVLRIIRNDVEELVGEALRSEISVGSQPPMIMVRFIGNEMEPIAKIKLHNFRVEYHVSTLMALLEPADAVALNTAAHSIASPMSASTKRQSVRKLTTKTSDQGSDNSDQSSINSKALKFDVTVRDSIIGLNPRKALSKGLIILTDSHLIGVRPVEEEARATLEIKKASIMVIDDSSNLKDSTKIDASRPLAACKSAVDCFSEMGYVSVGLISTARFTLRVAKQENGSERAIDLEISDELFVIETCADSTQTLQELVNELQPPQASNAELQYRTEAVPVEDLLASFSGDAFATARNDHASGARSLSSLDEKDTVENDIPQDLEFVSNFYNPNPDATTQGVADSMLGEDLKSTINPTIVLEIRENKRQENFQESVQSAPGGVPLEIEEEHFGAGLVVEGTAHRWNNKQNTYDLSNDFRLRGSPLRVRVRDVHIIWNLFDGYDWQHTRDVISQAIEGVQNQAADRISHKDKRRSLDPDDENESVIGDFLFNSIYIGIPANRDPKELAPQVNRDLNDLASESESTTTSSSSNSPSRRKFPQSPKRKLRLRRSLHHKITFEFKGIAADVVVFPPDTGEIQSSIDIRIQDLEIFDHVPTSTWKKFASYMHDAGERESGTSMIHLEVLSVRPVPKLVASELVMKVTILPLRLHVDQDALDFMTRFFEFRDNSNSIQASKSEAPFLQRVEVNSVRVKLDFKPKRVNYAGIRSGRTTEFMNFFILDRADMVLRHTIIYGVAGFDKLGKALNDIWMPDIKRNQLPGILAGLAPVRSLVNVGGGVRDLVVVPIREYRKDGRIVRSFQKGAVAFAKTTTSELVKLGAKLAIGTQTVLQGAEDLLSQGPSNRYESSAGWDNSELGEEEKEQISLYADQPVGVMQGLRGGYASLERDLVLAKDAIVAMPGEILERGTAGGVARAIIRRAPTVILRPAMGVSKAVGKTLMGANNSLDPQNRRRFEEKYKRH